jgi:hypothetical protein
MSDPLDGLEAEMTRLQREIRATRDGDPDLTTRLLDDLHRTQQAWDELTRPD